MTVRQVVHVVIWSHVVLLIALASAAYVFREPISALVAGTLKDSRTGAEDVTVGEVRAGAGGTAVTEAIAAANPAVVSVIVTKDVPILERYYEQFGFFQVPMVREHGTEEREVGGGSGFIVSPEGLVVTNRHVVADPDASYSVLLNDGRSYEVSVVARDAVLDVAVLRILAAGDSATDGAFPHLVFGNSDTLVLGQTVIAIGNALAEFRNSVSVGVVSGLARSIVAGDELGASEVLDEVIQTDAAINPGNSGGPLLNTAGEVVGVNVATALGSENIGFALPGNAVARVVESVAEHGRIIRPMIGVRYTSVTPALARREKLNHEYGALVTSDGGEPAVVPGSPADDAGLRAGDIILAVGDEELREGRTLASVVRRHEVGEEVLVRYARDGAVHTVRLTLDEAAGQ